MVRTCLLVVGMLLLAGGPASAQESARELIVSSVPGMTLSPASDGVTGPMTEDMMRDLGGGAESEFLVDRVDGYLRMWVAADFDNVVVALFRGPDAAMARGMYAGGVAAARELGGDTFDVGTPDAFGLTTHAQGLPQHYVVLRRGNDVALMVHTTSDDTSLVSELAAEQAARLPGSPGGSSVDAQPISYRLGQVAGGVGLPVAIVGLVVRARRRRQAPRLPAAPGGWDTPRTAARPSPVPTPVAGDFFASPASPPPPAEAPRVDAPPAPPPAALLSEDLREDLDWLLSGEDH